MHFYTVAQISPVVSYWVAVAFVGLLPISHPQKTKKPKLCWGYGAFEAKLESLSLCFQKKIT